MLKFSKKTNFYLICFLILIFILVLCNNFLNQSNIESFKTYPPCTPPSPPSPKPGPPSPPPSPKKPPKPPSTVGCYLVPITSDSGNVEARGQKIVKPSGTWKQKTQALIDYQEGKEGSTFPFVYPSYVCWNPGAPSADGGVFGPIVKGTKKVGNCNLSPNTPDTCNRYDIKYACSGPTGSVWKDPSMKFMTGADLQKLSGPTSSVCANLNNAGIDPGFTYNKVSDTGRPGMVTWYNDPTCGGFCKKQ